LSVTAAVPIERNKIFDWHFDVTLALAILPVRTCDNRKEHSMTERVLRRRDVEACTGLSRSTIYAMMAEGRFPTPIKLGLRAVGWSEAEVSDWLEVRKAQRSVA
jgi:prophage regulatory protein